MCSECGERPVRIQKRQLCHSCNQQWYKRNNPEYRERQNALRRDWYRNQGGVDYMRDMKLRRNFGISLEEYRDMERAQDGRCAICHSLPGKRLLAVDHDHETGRVRALLCANCNTALGHLKDDPDLLRKAADYLMRFR